MYTILKWKIQRKEKIIPPRINILWCLYFQSFFLWKCVDLHTHVNVFLSVSQQYGFLHTRNKNICTIYTYVKIYMYTMLGEYKIYVSNLHIYDMHI